LHPATVARTMRSPWAVHVRGPSTSASAAGCKGPRWTAGSGGSPWPP